MDFISSFEETKRITNDPTKEITDLRLINEEYAMCCWKHKNQGITSKTSCMAIGCLVTSLARVELYKLLESVGADKFTHLIIDSAIFVAPRDTEPFESSFVLGRLQNEIEKFGPGVRGYEFICLSQKTYFMKYQNPDGSFFYDSRVRGVTLNHAVEEQLQFSNVKSLIINQTKIYTAEPHKIIWDKFSGNIYSKNSTKLVKATYKKRIVLDDYSTMPYGYCKQ